MTVAWTVMEIFDIDSTVNTGRWRLPLYKCPIQPMIDVNEIAKLVHHSSMQLNLRICQTKDKETYENFAID